MKNLFDFLAENKITPNGLYVLHAMHNKYLHNKYINILTEQYRLELNNFLEQTSPNNYKITNKGLMLIRNSEKYFKTNKASKSKIPFEDWKDNIEAFNEFFPKGRRPNSSLGFRSPPKELYSRFSWFFQEYPEYTWDMVLNATKKYANSFIEEGTYSYMQSSKYFIKKDDVNKNTTSTLASICLMINEGEDFEIETGHHYFGP